MIPVMSGAGKRGDELFPIEEEPPLKKFSSKDKEENTFSFDCLSDELLGRISLFLPAMKSLFTFERLFKGAMRYTGLGWERLGKQQHLNFSWSLSDFDEKWYPEKARYLHAKVVIIYIEKRENLFAENHLQNPSNEQLNKFFRRFEGVMLRYPSSLGAFIWKDLNCLGKVESSHSHLFQKDLCIGPLTSLTAGDLLLRGLSYLSSHHALNHNRPVQRQQELRCLAFKALKGAILQGASCASALTIKMLCKEFNSALWYLPLVEASITKENNYDGLEALLKRIPGLFGRFVEDGVSYPPILARTALSKPDKEAEPLWDEAIEGYKDRVPAWVWEKAGRVKMNLQEHKKAGEYYTQALTTYTAFEINVPANLWAELGHVNIHLNELKKAECYLIKAMEACGSKVPADVLWSMSLAKFLAHDYREANAYLIQTISAHGNTIPVQILGGAMPIKFKVKEYDIAESYANQALAVYGDNPPIWLWIYMALIKMQLGKWAEAQDYHPKFYPAYSDEKMSMLRFEQLEQDFNEIIAAFKDAVPTWVKEHAALVKETLEKRRKSLSE